MDFQSGHMPRLWFVPIGVPTRSNQSMFLSHRCFSLSLFIILSLQAVKMASGEDLKQNKNQILLLWFLTSGVSCFYRPGSWNPFLIKVCTIKDLRVPKFHGVTWCLLPKCEVDQPPPWNLIKLIVITSNYDFSPYLGNWEGKHAVSFLYLKCYQVYCMHHFSRLQLKAYGFCKIFLVFLLLFNDSCPF